MNYSAGKSKSAVGPESMENFNGHVTRQCARGPLGP